MDGTSFALWFLLAPSNIPTSDIDHCGASRSFSALTSLVAILEAARLLKVGLSALEIGG